MTNIDKTVAVRTLIIVGIVILILAAAVLLLPNLNNTESDNIYEPRGETILQLPEIVVPEPTPAPSHEPYIPDDTYVCPIDFDTLSKINPDVYAYIDIPDTVVSWPILQHPTQNDYYLNRTIDGYNGLPGSIFTFSFAAKNFSDYNTVIYGHDMSDETMFGSLRNYREQEYFDTHRTIDIYTSSAHYVYEIFAAVIYSDVYLHSAFDFTAEADREAFIESIFENEEADSVIDRTAEISANDHLITLSTCISGRGSNRYLVVAVLRNIMD